MRKRQRGSMPSTGARVVQMGETRRIQVAGLSLGINRNRQHGLDSGFPTPVVGGAAPLYQDCSRPHEVQDLNAPAQRSRFPCGVPCPLSRRNRTADSGLPRRPDHYPHVLQHRLPLHRANFATIWIENQPVPAQLAHIPNPILSQNSIHAIPSQADRPTQRGSPELPSTAQERNLRP